MFLCFPEICKLFSKKFSIDVAEGGKIKKHSRSEFNFEAVTHKFQVLLLFYIYLFTFVHYSGPLVKVKGRITCLLAEPACLHSLSLNMSLLKCQYPVSDLF